eukprot:RCo020871
MFDKVDLPEIQRALSALDGGRYRLDSVIGKGSYGVVMAATDTQSQNAKVAIKRVSPEVFASPFLARRILREIALLAYFDHENIIGLHNIVRPEGDDFDCIFIVLDILEMDLEQLERSDQPITEEHVQYFTYQILRGLDVIHRAGVIHRDLTPSNVLLDLNCDLKIADFGLGHEVASAGAEMTDYVVMRYYRAPELVMEDKKYTTAVDVWSVGCIMGELCNRNLPVFQGVDRIAQLDSIIGIVGTPPEEDFTAIGSAAAHGYIRRRLMGRKGVRFEHFFQMPGGIQMKPAAVDLLQKLLTFNPKKRITAAEALRHEYFAPLIDTMPPNPPSKGPFCFNVDPKDLSDLSAVKRLILAQVDAVHRRNAQRKAGPLRRVFSSVSSLSAVPTPKCLHPD